jgi:murein DD-endopeptidase MepM/ murein hydrolase activator NlpD
MRKVDQPWHRGCPAFGAPIALAAVLAGCATNAPTPVLNGSQAPPPQQIIVRWGDTLSGIANAYHVPMAFLAQANHLTPPYRILAGQALIIPAGELNPNGPVIAMTGPGLASPPPGPVPRSATPPSPSVSAHPLASTGPPAGASTKLAMRAEQPIVTTPPQEIAGNPVNLSQPAPSPRESEEPSGLTTAPGQTAALERPPSGSHETFLWPVRGHVIEGFGAGPGGTHNDGVNIAAPHGTAIEATDGGIVAYTGNELRGYGNLILIKHPGGWISAYAHCDLILVKTGQRVARGQVIARVGATGNVSEPQLHFELRRGKKPVDPREYLPPPSTAATGDAHPS